MREQVKISKVKGNPNNPRIIKNDKFKKLVQSIKEFPEMLKLRPIVVDEDRMVLGGNMRLKASKDAGLKEVWIEVAEGLTEEQKKEFIVKDNVGFGEWEWDMLGNEWDSVQLAEWGLDVWQNEDDIKELKNPENKDTDLKFATELDRKSCYVVLKFNTDIDWIYAKTLFGLEAKYAKRQNGKEWNKGTGRAIDGIEAINKIRNES
jgi:ParB-like chromosome segregation protein Spo0J